VGDSSTGWTSTYHGTHTSAVAAHIPCPSLDTPTLMKMAKFAIDHEFGRKSPLLKAIHSPPVVATA